MTATYLDYKVAKSPKVRFVSHLKKKKELAKVQLLYLTDQLSQLPRGCHLRALFPHARTRGVRGVGGVCYRICNIYTSLKKIYLQLEKNQSPRVKVNHVDEEIFVPFVVLYREMFVELMLELSSLFL